jgi:hypothetical protein
MFGRSVVHDTSGLAISHIHGRVIRRGATSAGESCQLCRIGIEFDRVADRRMATGLRLLNATADDPRYQWILSTFARCTDRP